MPVESRMIEKPLLNSVRVISGLALLLLFLMPSDGLPIEICLSKIVTSVPCPACGMTRSLSSFLHLEWWKSLSYHPLGIFAGIYLLLTLISGKLLPEGGGVASLSSHAAMMLLALVFVVVWLIRLFWGGLP